MSACPGNIPRMKVTPWPWQGSLQRPLPCPPVARHGDPPVTWALHAQELLMAMDSWVTSLSYAAADTVSDNCGQLFMTDDTGKVAGAQPIVQDIRQAWLPASLISWVTKGPTPPSSSQGPVHTVLLKSTLSKQSDADSPACTISTISKLAVLRSRGGSYKVYCAPGKACRANRAEGSLERLTAAQGLCNLAR